MDDESPRGTRSSIHFMTLPLERKLPLVVLTLFSLVLAITLLVSYYEVRRAALDTANERVSGLGQAFGSIVEQQINGRLNVLRRTGRDTAVQAVFHSADHLYTPAAIRALAPLATAPADTATPPELLDAHGQPLGRPSLVAAGDEQAARDELAQSGAGSDSGHVTRLRLSGGHASYYLAAPIRSADGTLLGFIAQERRINVNPRTLPLLRGLIGSDIEFYFRNRDDNTWIRLTGASAVAPEKAARGTDTLAIYDHGPAGEVLGSTTMIHGTPLILTVERPMRAILARPLSTIRVLIAMSILLAVFGAFAVWLLSRRLVSPLGELTLAAEAMAQGEYAQRVDVQTGDEIGRLGSAFNRMAEEVQSSSETSSRAVSRLTRSVQTQEFLAEVSRILAGSVSDDRLLTDLTRYCVPAIADYCSIHVADDDGAIRRIETAHRDASALPNVRAMLARFEYHIDSPADVPTVIRTQQPRVVAPIDLDAAIRNAPDREAGELIRRVNPTAMMIVPLVARGRSFGAISFVMTGSARTFASDDLDIAMEIGRRAAVAIDNAVIFRRSQQLRMEAEAASSAKSDFLAKMSHEIRTPINAMMGYAELLQMGISGPVNEAQSKQLGRIRASGEHLTMLIGEILDLAKIEAGRMMVQPTNAPIALTVDAATSIVRPLATTKGVDLTGSVNANDDLVYFGDPQRVQQILTNLLSNAVKFTPSGGRVDVRYAASQRDGHPAPNGADWISVSVTDSGVGIEAADLERIFQPFVQVDTGYTRSAGGTGLGLTISRNLAQLMGGDISVESEPGVGSTFTLWLPCAIRAFSNV